MGSQKVVTRRLFFAWNQRPRGPIMVKFQPTSGLRSSASPRGKSYFACPAHVLKWLLKYSQNF